MENPEEQYKEVLVQVLSDVLERLAFMFAEQCSVDEFPASESGYMKTAMTFSGPFDGCLSLAVSSDMCVELAANILGAEPLDENVMDKAQDALKEFLNIACGQILTSLAGEEPVFDLSVPEAHKIEESEWKAMGEDPNAVGLLADDFPVLAALKTVNT